MLEKLLDEVFQRTQYGNPKFYHPFYGEQSKILRQYYQSLLDGLPLIGTDSYNFYNKKELILAVGFDRVVVGDYGAYVEFSLKHMVMKNIRNRWPGKPNRPVKYIWMESIDSLKTKVYFQQGTVSYADYKIGKYYISPNDLIWKEK